MNGIHAFGLIRREEGFRGLYRGFTAYMIGMSVYLTIIPILAHFSLLQEPIMGFDKDEMADL